MVEVAKQLVVDFEEQRVTEAAPTVIVPAMKVGLIILCIAACALLLSTVSAYGGHGHGHGHGGHGHGGHGHGGHGHGHGGGHWYGRHLMGESDAESGGERKLLDNHGGGHSGHGGHSSGHSSGHGGHYYSGHNSGHTGGHYSGHQGRRLASTAAQEAVGGENKA
ncbi:hypothetical protein WJX81_002572 [Elliptochloris bilobata]|uniref:Uncharacterized protein n=1 Tax=Elliptochloris bilobata TaxID=381761 RepID=A0AAW1S726_9CHLO